MGCFPESLPVFPETPLRWVCRPPVECMDGNSAKEAPCCGIEPQNEGSLGEVLDLVWVSKISKYTTVLHYPSQYSVVKVSILQYLH